MLGNLLDNAVEACKRLDDNIDKWITVKIESQKHLLFLVIENAVCEPPVKKNGTPISIKQDKMRHGYGILI